LNTQDDPRWEKWLSGRFTKTVRRGTGAQMDAMREEAAAIITVGEVEVVGFAPLSYEDMPKALLKMQVANLDRPRGNNEISGRVHYTTGTPASPVVFVNEDLGMTTGKTAAQVAHAVMAWLISHESR